MNLLSLLGKKLDEQELVKEMPWLLSLLQTDIVMIVGEPGTGKSSIAQSISMLRMLMFNTSIDIVSPSLDDDQQREIYLAGRGYGSKANGSFAEQLTSHFDVLSAQEFPENQGHSLIWDDVSTWAMKGVSPEVINDLLHTTYTTFRRKSIWSILVLHSLRQEYSLPGCRQGLLSSIVPYAAIIYLPSSRDKQGRVTFKRPGVSGGEGIGSAIRPEGWENISLHRDLNPKHLAELLGDRARLDVA